MDLQLRSSEYLSGLARPVDQQDPTSDERHCDRKSRRDRIAEQEMSRRDTENRREKSEGGELAGAVMRDHPEPAQIRYADDPKRLVREAAPADAGNLRRHGLAEKNDADAEHDCRHRQLIQKRL